MSLLNNHPQINTPISLVLSFILLKMKRNFERKELASRGCRCRRSDERSSILEEDRRFLEVLRQRQPHIFLQRGNTFIVFLFGELVHSTHLDDLLRVYLSLSAFLPLSLSRELLRCLKFSIHHLMLVNIHRLKADLI